MSSQPNKYITPILDTVIDTAIAHVQACLFNNDAFGTWRCLQKLVYATGDQAVIDALKPHLTDVENVVRRMNQRRGLVASDRYNQRERIRQYLDNQTMRLFERIMLVLEEHNYLKKRGGEFMVGREIT